MSQDPAPIDRKPTAANRTDRNWIEYSIRRVQEGREVETHFRLIFEFYEPRCRRLLSALVPDREVEDLAQDVMMRVYKGVKTFRLDASFDTWLIHIVKNVAKNAHRHRNSKKARATKASLEAMLEVGDDQSAAIAEPESPAADPLDETLASERLAHLEKALETLPARTRRCVELREFHGYKYKEIAKIQGVSVATVKKQIREGRKRLRPALGTSAKLFELIPALLMVIL